MKKITVLLLGCLLICGCTKNEYVEPKNITIEENENIYELYKDVFVKDLIKNEDIEIVNKNKLINTDTIGENKYTLEYEYNNKKYKHDITYTIKDVTAPIFIRKISRLNMLKDSKDDPCKSIIYSDDYDALPKCEVVGEYDTSTTGSYNVKYVLTDTSDNSIESNFTINVINEMPKNTSSGGGGGTSKLDFSTAIERYKNKDTMVGIDVSKWQGDIDFEKVKNAGCEFVIIRMGSNTAPDKDMSEDAYYRTNLQKAKAAGLKVGIYSYSSATTPEIARKQAKWMKSVLNKEQFDFPIAFDWENWSKFMDYNINLHTLNETFNAFYDELSTDGYSSMLYGSASYLNNVWENKFNYPVWLAHYTSKTDYAGEYIMWQMSNTGRIDGINGDVDIDVYFNKN